MDGSVLLQRARAHTLLHGQNNVQLASEEQSHNDLHDNAFILRLS